MSTSRQEESYFYDQVCGADPGHRYPVKSPSITRKSTVKRTPSRTSARLASKTSILTSETRHQRNNQDQHLEEEQKTPPFSLDPIQSCLSERKLLRLHRESQAKLQTYQNRPLIESFRFTNPSFVPFSAVEVGNLKLGEHQYITKDSNQNTTIPSPSFVLFESISLPSFVYLGNINSQDPSLRLSSLTTQHIQLPEHTTAPCAACAFITHLLVPIIIAPKDRKKAPLTLNHAHPQRASRLSSSISSISNSRLASVQFSGNHHLRRSISPVPFTPLSIELRSDTPTFPEVIGFRFAPLYQLSTQPRQYCDVIERQEVDSSDSEDEPESSKPNSIDMSSQDDKKLNVGGRVSPELGKTKSGTQKSKKQALHFSIKEEEALQRGWMTKPKVVFNPERVTLQEWATGRAYMASCQEKSQPDSSTRQAVGILENYANQQRFICLYGGTGCIFYPSGRICMCISSTKSGTYALVYDDDIEQSLLASFTAFGRGSCYDTHGNTIMICTDEGGEVHYPDGRQQKWHWTSPVNVTLALNEFVNLRLSSRTDISLIFRHADVIDAPPPDPDNPNQPSHSAPAPPVDSIFNLERSTTPTQARTPTLRHQKQRSQEILQNLHHAEFGIRRGSHSQDIDLSKLKLEDLPDKIFQINIGQKRPVVRPSLVASPAFGIELSGLQFKASVLLDHLNSAVSSASSTHTQRSRTPKLENNGRRRQKAHVPTDLGVSLVALPPSSRHIASSRPATTIGTSRQNKPRRRRPMTAPSLNPPPSRINSAQTKVFIDDKELSILLKQMNGDSSLIVHVVNGTSSYIIDAWMRKANRKLKASCEFVVYDLQNPRCNKLVNQHQVEHNTVLIYLKGRLTFISSSIFSSNLDKTITDLQKQLKMSVLQAERNHFLPIDFKLRS